MEILRNWHLIAGGIIFLGTYLLIASEKVHKTAAALLGAVLMILLVLPAHHETNGKALADGLLAEMNVKSVTENGKRILEETADDASSYSALDVFGRYGNFDVIFTLTGMMVLVNILSMTGFFEYVAIRCAKISRGSPMVLLTLLVLATAFLSAVLDNVTTVLLVAPVTLLVCSKIRVPVVPFLMAETMASNIGGTATLIGDPPNLIIGSIARFSFTDFLLNLTPVILLIIALYCMALWIFYRKKMIVTVERRAEIVEMKAGDAITDARTLRRVGPIMALTIAGFLVHGNFSIQPSVVAMCGATAALCLCKDKVKAVLKEVEWETLFFFMGLFILVAGAHESGLLNEIEKLLEFVVHWDPVVTILAVMWISAAAAAVMNNVSYTTAVAAMVAVLVQTIPVFRDTEYLRDTMWWGFALAVCLGGNGTLTGAAANVVMANYANEQGEKVDFKTFLWYGLPVTFFSMVVASIYIILRCKYYSSF